LASNPPSGTTCDPENDGTAMQSLGVHEHWNNSIDKQYSRNLGTGNGIELVNSDPLTCLCNLQGDDNDIDGADLAVYIENNSNIQLDTIAADYGRTDCHSP
jgi:hypothetical protein